MRALLPVLFALACIPLPRQPPPGAVAITDITQRIAFRGFSILPPSGQGWMIAPSFPSPPGDFYLVASMGKPLSRTHTLVASIGTWDLHQRTFAQPADFLAWQQSLEPSAIGKQVSPRHRILSSQVSLDGSRAWCVIYDAAVDDGGLLLAIHGLRCTHPRWPRYVIDANCSERREKDEPASPSASECSTVLKSLAFTADRPLFVTTIPVGIAPQGIAVESGSLWVAWGDRGLTRFDPATNLELAHLNVGADPVGASAGFGSIWVANRKDGTVSRVDPQRNAIAATIVTGGAPLVVAAGAGAVWVTNPGTGEIERIDPATNQVVARIPVGKDVSAIAASDVDVWAALYEEGKVLRIDPRHNSVAGSFAAGGGAASLLEAAGSLWVACQHEAAVVRLDPATGQVQARIPLRTTRPSGLDFIDGAIWITRYDENTIARIDPGTNQEVGRQIAVGRSPVLLTHDANGIWVSNAFSASISRVEF